MLQLEAKLLLLCMSTVHWCMDELQLEVVQKYVDHLLSRRFIEDLLWSYLRSSAVYKNMAINYHLSPIWSWSILNFAIATVLDHLHASNSIYQKTFDAIFLEIPYSTLLGATSGALCRYFKMKAALSHANRLKLLCFLVLAILPWLSWRIKHFDHQLRLTCQRSFGPIPWIRKHKQALRADSESFRRRRTLARLWQVVIST